MTPGIRTLDATSYHADQIGDTPSLSASIAHILLTQSPAHAKAAHPRLNPRLARDDKHHYDVGTIAHSILLEGESAAEILEYPDWRTKAVKEAAELARAHGRVPLLSKDWHDVEQMVAAAHGQLERINANPPLFTDGKSEQTLVWEDQDVTFRARLDWLRDDYTAVDDYKTAQNANPEKWTRSMFDHGCDLQAEIYRRGVKALTGHTPEFRFAVQEKTPPYALCVVSPGPDVYALAEAKVDHAIEVWRRCLEEDVWPAYPLEVCYAELPPWAEAQWLAREARAAA